MACYCDAEPCEEQRKFMEDLGFTLKMTEDGNECPWVLEENNGGIHTHHITLILNKWYKPEMIVILKMIILQATNEGKEQKAKVIREVLGVTSNCRCDDYNDM